MRILTVGNMYPPHHFGGYEQVWASAVSHLRSRGHEVRVLATTFRQPGVGDGGEPDVHRELRWYWRDHDFARVPLLDRLRIERYNHRCLRRHLGDLHPDIVSFWSMGGMSHSLIERVRRAGIPMVAFVHDPWLDYGRFTDQWLRLFYPHPRAVPAAELLTRLPARVDYRAAGRYVFVSDFIRRGALGLPIGLRDTAVAHSGIHPLFLRPSEKREWDWRLLYVGRIHPDKGIGDAVRTLTRLPPEASLTFAGSWDEREEKALEALVCELGLDSRVSLLGHRSREEIAGLYAQHDALLFPVRWQEPWGLVPLEAMGIGCPVIATAQGGSAEYLRDMENCLLVPPRDPEALARAVRALASDAELRRRLRADGFETAPRHTETIFNANVERHMAEVAGLAPTRGDYRGGSGEDASTAMGAVP